ncbi:MAG: hypothetical protein RBT75_06310 [Anaerolineae bacterium]|nr:hypothetical protein [Anaerolineae bacterium]
MLAGQGFPQGGVGQARWVVLLLLLLRRSTLRRSVGRSARRDSEAHGRKGTRHLLVVAARASLAPEGAHIGDNAVPQGDFQ